ncbi:glycosyltransferase [Kitasatospora sp. NBC_00240]|uniref:glycosyltransferase n=1 Tax=Kitasatospora sp. NBC_00240 TaxID=2903567 RepID=UPI00225B512A|nr:glycosyltransferase [Kitasatospora sp. NBC_00240]MCX5214002.1 glycosyltransferase [Kitasatospora sp. NBC_00240]
MSPRRTRVLWLTRSLGPGGAEQLLADRAKYADTARFEIEVAYLLPGQDALAPALERAGLRVHCLGGAPGAAGRTDPRWPWHLHQLLAERRYGLVHTHTPVPAAAARLLVLGRNAPRLVHTEQRPWGRHRLATGWADALTYRRNDAVIAGSRAVGRTVPAGRLRAGDRVTVVQQGPDLTGAPTGPPARAAARAQLGLPADAVVIGTAGGLTPDEDQATLLAAYAGLPRTRPDIRLVLIGGGPLESRLRARAAGLGLTDVVFAGPRPDVPALLPALDVFALSSRRGVLPSALPAAMICGLPSVGTRVGATPEVLDDDAQGLLVPPGDPVALGSALGRLVADAGLRERLGAAARERAAGFGAAAAQRAVEAVYRQVLRP